MSKGMFIKDDAPNKRIVQDIIYKWLSPFYKIKNYCMTIAMLPGYVPERSLEMYHKYFTIKSLRRTWKPIIHAFERDMDTYTYLKQTQPFQAGRQQVDFRLNPRNVRDAVIVHDLEDLDFCTNLFADRTRQYPNVMHIDSFSIIRKRLGTMVTSTKKPARHSLMFTVSLRNGLGKESTTQCLRSLVYMLGWNIDYIDNRPPTSYGKGIMIEGSGRVHENGNKYYAYEHVVQLSSMAHCDPYAKRNVGVRMFTYTDGTPMLTFAITFEN